MVSPFLAPDTAWHMMHAKADAMGMTQWVAPCLDRSLLRVCNTSTETQLPEIWNTIAPLNKYRALSAMEAACRRIANSLRFRPPRIPHAVAVMVMDLAFTLRTRKGRGTHSTSYYSLTSLPRPGWRRSSSLGIGMQYWGGHPDSFADMSLLMRKQKVAPIAGWYKASSQLEHWTVLCTVFLGDDCAHPATYKISLQLEEMSGVSPRLRN